MANFFGGYPQPQQFQQYPSYQQANNNVIVVPVQGESGASMYPVAAGNTVLLMDFNLKKFWIKATDINGLPSKFAAFDFKEEVKPTQGAGNFVSRDEFDEWKRNADTQFNQIINSLNVLIGGKNNASEANAKSNAVQKAV